MLLLTTTPNPLRLLPTTKNSLARSLSVLSHYHNYSRGRKDGYNSNPSINCHSNNNNHSKSNHYKFNHLSDSSSCKLSTTPLLFSSLHSIENLNHNSNTNANGHHIPNYNTSSNSNHQIHLNAQQSFLNHNHPVVNYFNTSTNLTNTNLLLNHENYNSNSNILRSTNRLYYSSSHHRHQQRIINTLGVGGSHVLLSNQNQILNGQKTNGLKLKPFTPSAGSALMIRTKVPGATEFTKGAISIPKLILDASPKAAQPYLQLMRFDRPIGTWLLYWPCTWSIAMAAQPGCWPDFYMLALFGTGAFFMRGAGCIINDMWDRDFDKQVERTMLRPLASGQVSFPQAVAFLASQLAISFAILMQLNWYSIGLGVASIGIVVTYPAFKRFTYWPQIVLGFAFNYGALLGWAAVRGSCDWSICLPLYFLCHMWTMVYDTVYAHQDKTDDLLVGVKSTALRFGDDTKLWLSSFTGLMAGGLLYVGSQTGMTWPYYTGATITIASIAAQLYRLDINDPQACGDAFRFHFYIGFLMFVSIMMGNRLKEKEKVVSDGNGGENMEEQLVLQS